MADELAPEAEESFEDTAGAAWDAAVAADEEPENGDAARAEAEAGEGEPGADEGEQAEAAKEEPDGDAEGDASAGLLDAPTHWAAEDQTMFRAQTPEAQKFLLERNHGMEAAHTKRSQEVAEETRAIQPLSQMASKWGGYLGQVGQDPAQAFDMLMAAEHQLRTGTLPQKRAMLQKLAQDYAISFEDESNPEYQAPDPQVMALQQQMQQLQAGQQFNILSAQQQRESEQLHEITAFRSAQTEAGQLANPYCEEVGEDMVRLAQANVLAGQQPTIAELYEQACWANPQVRAKLIAAEKHSADQVRKTDEKARLGKAKLASGGISGAGSPSQKEQPKTIEEEISDRWDEMVAG